MSSRPIRIVILLLVLLVASMASHSLAQQAQPAGQTAATVVVPPGKPTVFLWPNGAPGSESRKDEPERIQGETIVNVHNPSIIVFLPPKATSTGVGMIVAPGGGHTSLWIMHEGFNPAQALAAKGIAAFVLKNRLESSELHMYAKTGHGFGLRPERAGQSHQEWPVQLVSFLRQTGMIK